LSKSFQAVLDNTLRGNTYQKAIGSHNSSLKISKFHVKEDKPIPVNMPLDKYQAIYTYK